jgi:UDP-glucose 4-epimerase
LSFESNNPELTTAFASRRVLVTGGCGFVGSHLVRRLVQMGSRVTSLGGNPNEAQQLDGARYIFGDISRDTLQAVGFVPDTIFHLAGGASVAVSVADPPADFLTTVFSSVLLLDFLRTYWSQSQLVYVSSAAIYGEAEHKKASHDLSCLPISPYGVHKKQVESLLLDHARMYQTRSVIVRPFSVYGPGLRKQLLWDAMQKASRSCFEFFGSGHELRDWIYISDLVNCLLQVAEHANVDVPVYNAGTCRAVSVRDVLAELFRAAGIDREPAFLGMRKEGDPDRLVADDSAEGLLGPLFLTPLSEGLLAYVNWYFQRGSHV